MNSIRIIFFLIFAPLCWASCSFEVCGKDDDCRLNQHCDIGLQACVQCTQHSHCQVGEFCCQGTCKALALVDQFCGCELRLNQGPGVNCKSEFGRRSDVSGPNCFVNKDVQTNVYISSTCTNNES